MKAEIGKRIKNIRENMNMTKEGFAKLLGISGQYLGMVERGKSYLSIEKLKILCDITNLSADYILFGKDDNIKNDTKEILSEFSDKQLEIGCDLLKKLALFIKNT
ncbi:MAG: helix-turn-helix transcriptional regulator [Clostridia bacterium]|nr:helix-turn-helix transcriptional regulator [Clostridia bacterium]